jgi:hypothetical protein
MPGDAQKGRRGFNTVGLVWFFRSMHEGADLVMYAGLFNLVGKECSMDRIQATARRNETMLRTS